MNQYWYSNYKNPYDNSNNRITVVISIIIGYTKLLCYTERKCDTEGKCNTGLKVFRTNMGYHKPKCYKRT